MNSLRSLFLALCFAMIAGGLIRLIAPQGGWEKTVRSITGLFIIGCVLIPISGWYRTAQDDEIPDLSGLVQEASQPSESDAEQTVRTLVQVQAQKDLEDQIKKLLEAEEYPTRAVAVSLLKGEREYIGAEIIVTLDTRDFQHRDAIFSLLSERYPEPFVIAIRQEDAS